MVCGFQGQVQRACERRQLAGRTPRRFFLGLQKTVFLDKAVEVDGQRQLGLQNTFFLERQHLTHPYLPKMNGSLGRDILGFETCRGYS